MATLLAASTLAAPASQVIKHLLMFVAALVVIILLYKLFASENFGGKSYTKPGWFALKWKRA